MFSDQYKNYETQELSDIGLLRRRIIRRSPPFSSMGIYRGKRKFIKLPPRLSQAQYQQLVREMKGGLSGVGDLGKIKFFKKIEKLLRKPMAAVAGIVSLGILKPKAFGVKNPKSVKFFKIGKVVGLVAGAVAGAVFAGPVLLTALKGAAGKLSTMGIQLFSKTKDFLVKNKGMTEAVASAATNRILAGQDPIPSELQSDYEQTALSAEAGMFGGLGNYALPIAVGVGALAVGYMMFSGGRGQSTPVPIAAASVAPSTNPRKLKPYSMLKSPLAKKIRLAKALGRSPIARYYGRHRLDL